MKVKELINELEKLNQDADIKVRNSTEGTLESIKSVHNYFNYIYHSYDSNLVELDTVYK